MGIGALVRPVARLPTFNPHGPLLHTTVFFPRRAFLPIPPMPPSVRHLHALGASFRRSDIRKAFGTSRSGASRPEFRHSSVPRCFGVPVFRCSGIPFSPPLPSPDPPLTAASSVLRLFTVHRIGSPASPLLAPARSPLSPVFPGFPARYGLHFPVRSQTAVPSTSDP